VKAIVHDTYGAPAEVLRLRDVPRPTPGDDEVLVRVRAASVNPADWHLIRGVPYIARLQFGLRAPKHTVAGCDLAGQVEEVGRAVTAFRPGDEVFGAPALRGFGAFAEYAAVPQDVLAPKPTNLSFEHAAAVPLAALTALQGVRDHGRTQAGQRVLVIGASGGVGTFAVQIATSLGAEVTGVCSTRNVDLVRSLGAVHVIDYTQHDVTRGAQRYDVVLQVAGTASPSDLRRVLTPKGTLLLSSGESRGRWLGPVARMLRATVLSPFVGQRLGSFIATTKAADLEYLRELIEAGAIAPVIDRSYPLAQVPEAIAYLEEGHARGKVVVTV
jgi:NADPH:quinone reductase-like Zn-dependent oxidoreductase